MKLIRSSVAFALVSLTSTIVFTSCSFVDNSFLSGGADAVDEPTVKSILVSYNRSTLGRTDYEQYRILPNKNRGGGDIIWECGRIAAGRFNPQSQDVVAINEQELAKITSDAAEARRLVQEKGAQFNAPGSTPEFFDPGQYTLKVDSTNAPQALIRTTFDSVAIPQANREFVLNKLTVAVRSATLRKIQNGESTGICGIKDFYLLAAAKR